MTTITFADKYKIEIDDGIIIIYSNQNKINNKILIEKDEFSQYYDFKGIKNTYPLQEGSGKYKILILENIIDIKYKIVFQKEYDIKINNEFNAFLKPTQSIPWNYNMNIVKFTNELVKNTDNAMDKFIKIYNYIIENIDYDYDKLKKLTLDYLPNVDLIFEEKKGICYDYAMIFAIMTRSQNIPSKLIKGYKNDIKGYHAWNEIYLDNEWKIIDITYDKATGKKNVFKNFNEYEKIFE